MSEPVHPTRDRAHAEEHRVGRRAQLFALAKRHALSASLVLVVASLLVAFAVDELWSAPRVARGVHFADAKLGRLSPDAARLAVEPRARERERRALEVRVDAKLVARSFRELGLGIDVPATVARALTIGRDRGPFLRFFAWAHGLVAARPLEPRLAIDAAVLDRELDRLERETLVLPFAGGFRLVDGRVEPDPPRSGRRLDRARARAELERALAGDARKLTLASVAAPAPLDRAALERAVARARELSSSRVVLADESSDRSLAIEPHEVARVLRLTPNGEGAELTVDARELELVLGPRRAALESEPKPARFVIGARDAITIEPSEPDARVEPALLADALLSAASSPDKRGLLPLVRQNQPSLTTEAAAALGVRRLVSSFTTRHPCCERRVDNIHRIADLIDGLVVKPGETVSVNAVVGPRTSKNGFVPAPTIEEGEVVETVGGGISQFATTLFNALFYGGYAIVERQPHTYWFPRYPMGHEATLSFPKPDLVFKNDTEHGMLIDTQYTKTSITVRIFGDNGGRKVEAKVSARQNVVDPPVEIQPNPEVEPDRERTKEAGMVGWSVIVGRLITFADGTHKEERRKVTYRPKTRRVEVHPCRVPKGEKGYTGERCPEPEDSGGEASADDE